LILLRAGLAQIRHATNHGTCNGAGTSQETTQEQDDSACVSRWFCAQRNEYTEATNKESDHGASDRTN
jgi:hypothetical protein